MSYITFLASSKPFVVPEHPNVKGGKARVALWVDDLEQTAWSPLLKELFTLPYIYEISNAYHPSFLTYLEHHMEIGDILELLSIPSPYDFYFYQHKLKTDPKPIYINLKNLTYKDINGTYTLSPQTWTKELILKDYTTPYGITKIIK